MAEKLGSKAALATIHGMGRAKTNYADTLRRAVHEGLGNAKEYLHFGSIYYEDILGPNQTRVWNKCSGQLRWKWFRQFALFFLADAGALESRKSEPDSAYVRVQIRIAKVLYRACKEAGTGAPLTMVAHSLGCQVVSSYLWDAQQYRANGTSNVGIWSDFGKYASDIAGGGELTEEERYFVGGGTLRYFYTTGCNIPMFLAGHAETAIEPIRPATDDFEWHNFYDKDDVLGWPLRTLSSSYRSLVCDHEVNAAGGLWAWLLASWNPFSHSRYWHDKKVLNHLNGRLAGLL